MNYVSDPGCTSCSGTVAPIGTANMAQYYSYGAGMASAAPAAATTATMQASLASAAAQARYAATAVNASDLLDSFGRANVYRFAGGGPTVGATQGGCSVRASQSGVVQLAGVVPATSGVNVRNSWAPYEFGNTNLAAPGYSIGLDASAYNGGGCGCCK